MNVTTILIQATALMAALGLLRPLLKRYLSARARCALWAIPAARLIFPFEIKSAFSLLKAAKPVEQAVENVVAMPVLREPVQWTGTPAPMPTGSPALTAPVTPLPDPAVTAESALSLGEVLLAVWAVGAAVTLVWFIWANVRFFRNAKRMATTFETDCKLPVYLYPELATPCLAGVFRPRIYINERAVSNDAVLRMTLRHELTHYKRLDHIWGLVRGVLTCIYWFHPLVWLSGEWFRHDSEAACDERATRGMDAEDRENYGLALIMLAGKRPNRGLMVCLSTMSGGKKQLYERIKFLSRSRKAVRAAAVIAAMLAVILVCTMCTAPEEEKEQTEQPDAEQSQSGKPEETKKPTTEQGEFSPLLTELAYYMERSDPGAQFRDMDDARRQEILGNYAKTLEGYELLARERTDGQGAYILGEYRGVGEDPLKDGPTADRAGEGYLLRRITIGEQTVILVEEETFAGDLRYAEVVSSYQRSGEAHIVDALNRGVTIMQPLGPSLEVPHFSPAWGGVREYIPLSGAEYDALMAETPVPQTKDDYALVLHEKFGTSAVETYYNWWNAASKGVPERALKLAVEKCGLRFETPEDVGNIKTATLEHPFMDGAATLRPGNVADLEEILKSAQRAKPRRPAWSDAVELRTYGRLSLTMEDGSTMTVYKSIGNRNEVVFGSFGVYVIPAAQEELFWAVFGLDPKTKMPVEIPDTLSDQALELAYCIELSTLNEFRDMDPEVAAHWLGEYGDLLKDYCVIARERVDGQGSYILGEYWGEGESPMQGLSTYGIGMSNLLLCREEDYPDDFTVADLMMGKGDWKDYGTVITQTNVFQHFLDRPMVVITPKNEDSYYTVVDEYVKRGPGRILEAEAQGNMLTIPTRPYLEVYQVSERYGETVDYIPITAEEVDAILSEEPISLNKGLGFSARLCSEDEDIIYTERTGIPPSVLDLAVKRCNYRFADPSYIKGPLLGARLECAWMDEALIVEDEADLKRLEEILKNAEFMYVGACGYGAKLTLAMPAGESLVLFKGTDDCDTIVFGSWGGYALGDAENTEFWNLFGLDAHTKLPLE